PIHADGLRADFARNDEVPYVDVTATLDPENGQVSLFMLNRDLDAERELVVEFQDPTPKQVLACETLAGPDLKAFNTFNRPMTVSPRTLDAPSASSKMTFKLPARSYTVAHLATA
ncbi:MAG TPA: alpha-L-arabinofuranosidase C-terminal domain-containing protein, partial [Candidatus Acidoferrales bacterium]|nr:alpha-L-arabinofuranosidase C-terminal domain-containing protein [Candidatus Acidoferrales bacterium]